MYFLKLVDIATKTCCIWVSVKKTVAGFYMERDWLPGLLCDTSWVEPIILRVWIVGLHTNSKFCARAVPTTSCCVGVMVMQNG